MSRKRKHKKHEEHVDESWLLPYADLLTLLLALFIVLFATSSIDAQKFNKISDSFSSVLHGGEGLLESNTSMTPGNETSSTVIDQNNEEEKKDKETQEAAVTQEAVNEEADEANLEAAEREELQKIQEKIETYIKDEDLSNKFSTDLTDEGLLLTINDNVLFNSGSSEVSVKDEEIAREISDLLVMDPPREVIISGHTDDDPISTSTYHSNWELSVMRSVNFMKVVLENDKLDPRWFSAKGYGEFKPIASNDTAGGKEKNRRVEVLILPRTAKTE
ncbi:flagellar motor protein MotB [Terribacillus sp. DMT04]|uniref:flagellar motor protein MotB n=1 Tax=Terribacillus sp. DMT04 TaxID=2850441 RepID=UPI001C2CB384|nr:flagellar motor protein MotB [Terribacillus sp. DMT04]QXE01299.1 flagellar motor protein MotB [Terribacillus sp. DMT04]